MGKPPRRPTSTPPSDVPTGRWFDRLLRGLPTRVRYRLFLPAYEDLRQEHLLERGRGVHRAGRLLLDLRFRLSVLLLIARCYRGTPGLIHPVRACASALRALFLGNRAMFSHDLRQAVRLVRKRPAFTAVAILILATGIGAATAIFSVVNAVLLRPLPFTDAARLVALAETYTGGRTSVSPVNFMDWQRDARSFEAMALYIDQGMTLSWKDGSEAVSGYAVSSRFFPVLGVRPVVGRWFGEEDDLAGPPRRVVLGYGLWQRAFGGADDVVGREALFDGEPYVVIGVAPQGAEFPEGAEAWFSLGLTPRHLASSARGAHYAEAVARVRRGVSLQQANLEMRTIASRLASEYPRTNEGSGVEVIGLLDAVVGHTRRALLLVFGAVGCLLLVACVNVSGLLMARAAARRTEMAVRAALGAGRIALMRQVLVESFALSALSAVVGTLMAAWGTEALLAIVPSDLPRVEAVGLDLRVLAFTVAVASLAAVCFGLLPALQSAGLAGALKDGRQEAGTSGGRRVRSALVTVEVALALVLLIGAGLAIRSFDLLTRVSPGFDAKNVLTFAVSLPEGVYKEPAQSAAFFRELVSALDHQPGVASSAVVMIAPVARSGFGGTFSIDGRPPVTGPSEPRAQLRPISPAYFRTLGVAVARGRAFTDRDGEAAPPVAIISDTTARRFWPGEDPIGKRLRVHVSAVRSREPVREIVGVVPDVKTARLDLPAAPVVYVPHAQHPAGYMTVLVRTSGDAAAFATTAAATLRQRDRSLVALDVQTFEARVAATQGSHRFRAVLLGLFAGAAFLLAIVGLYAVVAYSTGLRRREIGVRMALGAGRRQILAMVVADGMRPVAAGLILGCAAALALSRVMTGLLFGVRPFEPVIVAAVAAGLAAAAAAACYLPARRATAIDAREALRAE